jgi:hypothetical protein
VATDSEETPTIAGTAGNVVNTSIRRDLNSSREGSNSRDYGHSRDSRDKTTAVLLQPLLALSWPLLNSHGLN